MICTASEWQSETDEFITKQTLQLSAEIIGLDNEMLEKFVAFEGYIEEPLLLQRRCQNLGILFIDTVIAKACIAAVMMREHFFITETLRLIRVQKSCLYPMCKFSL